MTTPPWMPMETMMTTTTSNEEETETPPPPPSSKLRQRMRRPLVTTSAESAPGNTPDEVESKMAAPPRTEPSEEGDPEVVDVDPSEQRAKKFERLGLGPSKAQRQMREEDDKNILSWLRSLETDAPIRVQVHRKEPKEFTDPATGQRKKVDGMIRRYDRPIDEEEIQRNHGGGTFQLVIQKRNQRGQYDYFTARTIEIGGDPRLDDVHRTVGPAVASAPAGPQPLDPVMGKLVDHMLADSRRPPPPAPDLSGAVQMATEPLRESLRRMEAQIDRREREIAELRKPDTSQNDFTQRMLDKFIDQDSVRLQQVRTQFESEIRMIKEQAVANEARIRDQFDRDKEHLYRAHEREVSTLKSTTSLQIAALEQSFAMQKTVLESDNRRLERELNELRIDVKELRNKKEPSFKDQIAGIRDMKDVLEDVIGGDDPKEEKSTIVKVLEGAAQSDVIAGFAQRLMSAGQGSMPVAEPPQISPKTGHPTSHPRPRGPRLIRDRRNGQVYATDGTKAIPVQRKQPLAPPPVQTVAVNEAGEPIQAVPAEAPVEPQAVEAPIPYVEPDKVAFATEYMTKAYGNNIDPGDFVTGVKMFIPPELVAAIREMGVEDFLRRVGGLADDHPLLSQAGKNWSRKVAKHMVGE